jgi:hypothetical protein
VPGHFGAAVISAHYFVLDNGLDERAAKAVTANAEAFIAKTPVEFPEPDPGPGRSDPAKIVETLSPHVHEYRSGGHDTIYAALALRALRDAPDFATPAIVDGVCRLLDQHVAAYRPARPSEHQRANPLPPYGSKEGLATYTLRAILRPWDHVRDVGASGVLHWVTFAEALTTLEELGHEDVARRGHAAHQMQVNRPVERRGDRPPSRPEPLDWLSASFWESDVPRRAFDGSWLAGHSFKLPYSLFRLLRLVDDEELRTAALARASVLPMPFE